MNVTNVYAYRGHNFTGSEIFTASDVGMYLAIAFTCNGEASTKDLVADISSQVLPVYTIEKYTLYNQDELNKRQIQYKAYLYNLHSNETITFSSQGSTGSHNSTAFYVFKINGVYNHTLSFSYFQSGVDNNQIGPSHNFDINLGSGEYLVLFTSSKDSGTASATLTLTGTIGNPVTVDYQSTAPIATAVDSFTLNGDAYINIASTNDGGSSYATKQYQIIRIGDVEPPPPPTGEFPVYIQRNNSEAIHLDKDLTDIITAYAWLKESTSIINPTFVLEASLSDLVRANYVTVPQFGRSYFIKDIVSITTDLLEVNCHVDVLSSFKDDIRANRGITHRQEERWNLHLNDGVLQAYQNPIITTQAFPHGFTENNFVLIAMGSRGAGINPWGGYINYDDIYVDEEGGGDGNNESRTTAGMYQYALAQVGKPYWFGTFGNLASATLLSSKRSQYPNQYPDPGNPDFTTQFGERVHDCVGLIKGYRWRGLDGLDPVYVPSEDVDVKGLWAQCTRRYGEVTPNAPFPPVGAVAFTENFDHCGVFAPSEGGFFVVIEAKGHRYGVVKTVGITAKFKYWGVPDWMKVTTRSVV